MWWLWSLSTPFTHHPSLWIFRADSFSRISYPISTPGISMWLQKIKSSGDPAPASAQKPFAKDTSSLLECTGSSPVKVTRYKKLAFFPIVSSAALWLPSHECPGYYKSHAHMSSASMVSCLLSECYLVLSVPIIFKLALDWFQKLQCYSWKLQWSLSSLFEQGVGTMLGLAGGRCGRWGLGEERQREFVSVCANYQSESLC